MKQLILQFVPESWHVVYHKQVCLRLGVSGETSIMAAGTVLFMLVGFLLLFMLLKRQLDG